MPQAVKKRVGQRRLPQGVMPGRHGPLPGEHRGPALGASFPIASQSRRCAALHGASPQASSINTAVLASAVSRCPSRPVALRHGPFVAAPGAAEGARGQAVATRVRAPRTAQPGCAKTGRAGAEDVGTLPHPLAGGEAGAAGLLPAPWRPRVERFAAGGLAPRGRAHARGQPPVCPRRPRAVDQAPAALREGAGREVGPREWLEAGLIQTRESPGLPCVEGGRRAPAGAPRAAVVEDGGPRLGGGGGRALTSGGGGHGCRARPVLRSAARRLSAQAPRVSARRQAASRRAGRSRVPSRLIPHQARHPCGGCGRAARLVSTTGAVAGPLVAAQGSTRGGVQAASCGGARGLGAAPVRGRPGWGARRWLATRCPVAQISPTGGTQADVQGLAHQRRGHGVGVAVDRHVVSTIDPARVHAANASGGTGRGRRAGRSSGSNRSGRAPGRFLQGRAVRVDRRGTRAAWTAASAKPG